MESAELIETSRIYVDTKGAGRLYIPKGIVSQLGCRNKEKMLLNLEGKVLAVKSAEGSGAGDV